MKVLLFGGTTEGRLIAEALAGSRHDNEELIHGDRQGADVPVCMHICVATDYGAGLLPQDDRIMIHHERMDEVEMEDFIRSEGFNVCIDATHPYASIVSENISRACGATGLKLYRVARTDVSNKKDILQDEKIIYFDDISDAVSYLNKEGSEDPGNIFITTGSKDLEKYTALSDYTDRCYIRVLPSAEAIDKCMSLGFKTSHLICMQGPFDCDLNRAMLKSCGASVMVTKDSGQPGGFSEKIDAALDLGVTCLVIGRPAETGEKVYTLREILDILGLKEETQKKAYIIGMGCGMGHLTREAIDALKECSHIIGAERLIDDLTRLQGSRIGQKRGGDGKVKEYTGKRRGEKQKEIFVTYDKDEIERYIKDKEPDSVALLYSGDIGFYSGAAGIVDRLDRYEIVTIPGISSGVYLCDKLMIPWQDVRFLSCHGRDLDLEKELGTGTRFVILLGREDDAGKICREVCDIGYAEARVYIGEELGYKDEKIRSGRAGDFTDVSTSALAVILLDLTGLT